jgi:hypothetical protein
MLSGRIIHHPCSPVSDYPHQIPLGFVEGLNNKIRVIQRRAYGLRDEDYLAFKIMTLGLPPLEKTLRVNQQKS